MTAPRNRCLPKQCPRCHEGSGRPNGVRVALAKGPMQQFRCSKCRKSWSVADSVDPLFVGQRVHVKTGGLLQAFALMVLGIPMNRVEKLVEIKAETIKAKLLLVLRTGRSELLQAVLKERFRMPRSYYAEFDSLIVRGLGLGQANFLDWSRELRRQDPATVAACARVASRILGRPVKVSEIRASYKRQRKVRV